jgi:hypothetical protein
MKKKLVLLFIAILSFSNLFSQTEKKKDIEYMDVWVYYSVKGVINSRMYIDIGTSKDHSLYGIVSNGEGDNIIFNEDGVTKVFTNEVDLLKHLLDLGWEIYNIQSVKLIARDYIKYLMIKKE